MGEAGRGGPGSLHVRGEGIRRGEDQKWDQEAGQGSGRRHPGQTGQLLQGAPLPHPRPEQEEGGG